MSMTDLKTYSDVYRAATKRWDELAKPIGGLGKLEAALCKLCAIYGNIELPELKKAVVIFCSDNGVVARGVSQTDSGVTAIVMDNIARRRTAVCKMADVAKADIFVADVGVNVDSEYENVLNLKSRKGTEDFTIKPALREVDVKNAMDSGRKLACELAEKGYNIIAAGEMGIGNTTTATALLCAITGEPPEKLTGRGAGLSGDGLARKISAIKTGLELHNPNPNYAYDLLCKLGGLDIAALVGFYQGAVMSNVCVVLDGLITCVAALIAKIIDPEVDKYLLASHRSAEPAAGLALSLLGLDHCINAGFRLGEGTGSVAMFQLIDLAVAVYNGVPTFEEQKIEKYFRFEN